MVPLSQSLIWLWQAAFGLVLVLLIACGAVPGAERGNQMPSNATQARFDAARPEEPDRTDVCASLREPLAETLDVDVALDGTRFRDLAAGVERAGCVLAAKGDGTQFADFLSVSEQVATMLTQQGWSVATPLADGPTGTVLGFTRKDHVAQLTVDWQPAPSADCPIDQPVAECQLAPAQKLFTIRLELAAAVDPTAAPVDAAVLK